MTGDFFLVLRWWGTLFLVGAVAYPLTKRLFTGWYDHGYLFSKAVGMAVVTWIVYVAGTLRVLPFTTTSIILSLAIVFLGGIFLQRGDKGNKGSWGKTIFVIVLEELFFLVALLFWSWIKGHEPSLRGLEKFMDFGFMKSILASQYFPPGDMWYPPLPINYYYFGHMVTALLTKLSGLDLTVTFNLMLASLFALTLTMSFSIGYQIGPIRGIGRIGAGILTAFLVTMAGNMQTVYAFTRGYTGDNAAPFWELGWRIGDRGWLGAILDGLNTYWYANATRFIPFTIHEFPSYSFVVSDVHGHVLSIPFVLLAIGMLIGLRREIGERWERWERERLIFYGFLVGILLMTNALDGPIYFALLVATLIIHNSKFKIQNLERWKEIGRTTLIVLVAAGITSLPFLSHFKSFVSGVAVNCPPALLANSKIGPLLFEGVEKCQRSPLWMMALLWGFFVYCGMWLVVKMKKFSSNTKIPRIEVSLLIFFIFSLVLIIVPEFFYFKDIYPMHFRSNTMFKLGYEAFILFSIVAGYTIVTFLFNKGNRGRIIFFIFLLPQLFLVSIYSIFSVRSYFGGLRTYEGLDGLAWLERGYPDDWRAINWLNNELRTKSERFALVEADGDSYTDYARISAFTGMPTIIGWPVHEWLWRGTYDVVAPRREEVRQIYESDDLELTRTILARYGVRYVVVGSLERQKYPALQEWKFGKLGEAAFQSGQTTIYQMR